MDATVRLLVLGAAGMFGNAAFRVLSMEPGLEVYGAARRPEALPDLNIASADRLVTVADVLDLDAVRETIMRIGADVVINAVGVVKQLQAADDPLVALPINALFPHQLALLCREAGARLIQISTDCVFNGLRGGYTEDDIADATDLYGRSKLLGEVDYPNAITLRTSIVGHELGSRHGLIEWFLSQNDSVLGFRRAIFSGLTTVELARVIARNIIPRPELRGIYHVGAEPINKHDLLTLVAEVYGKRITIVPTDQPFIDRSLRSDRFRAAANYVPSDWPTMIRDLHLAYFPQPRRPSEKEERRLAC